MSGPPRFRRLGLAHTLVAGYAVAVALGSVLLWLPIASEPGVDIDFGSAMFTATSAVTVTGLTVVDTASSFSTFGEVVIALLIQVGGLGIATGGSLLALVVFRRLSLRHRMIARAESGVLALGDVRRVVRAIALFSFACEALVAALLTSRFAGTTDEPLVTSAWSGLFHAVSAFNNAGFSIYADSLARFQTDWLVVLPIAAALVVGGIGIPVVLDLWRAPLDVHRWSLHTRLTVAVTAVLLVAGVGIITAVEWGNPASLGVEDISGKLAAGLLAGATPRTAGFAGFDYALAETATIQLTIMLMFIGGGAASTAGGVKVTTLGTGAAILRTELRGHRDVHVLGRRLRPAVQRQALAILFTGALFVAGGTMLLALLTEADLTDVVFEVVSALGTVGLTRGLTPELDLPGRLVVMVLMLAGRVGPLTLAAAVLFRQPVARYRLATATPIIG